MSKWTSRKWWAFLITEFSGIVTAGAGYLMGEKEVGFAGLAMMIASAMGYWKAEKDVDVAHADAEAQLLSQQLFHDQHCPICNKKD